MDLIVEDGSGKADAESYVSVADADTYHSNHGNAAWTGDAATKEAALRRATRYIDGRYKRRWRACRTTRNQALDWPREGVYDNDEFLIDSGEIPQALINATAEGALRELASPGVLSPDLERGGEVESSSVTAGPVNVSKSFRAGASARTAFTVIDDLLSGLLGPSSVATVRRA